jgi:hypothetical protein
VKNPTIHDRPSPLDAAGDGKTLWHATLQAGAKLLQSHTPLGGFDAYVVGLHCARDDPSMQMEAHHYCKQMNEEFLQCLIFDGNTSRANLIGVEYIVSERLFETLPPPEREYWHPHNYEILSGQLTAPGLPKTAERAFLALLMNSYGKTWHCWHTGRHDRGGTDGEPLPVGDAMLMWSFNHDGEADESLKRDFQEKLGIDELRQRDERRPLLERAHPQEGVDRLAADFPNATPIAGVIERPAS